MPKVAHQPALHELQAFSDCMQAELNVAQNLAVPAVWPRFGAGHFLLNNFVLVPLINGGPHDQPCHMIRDQSRLPIPDQPGSRSYPAACTDGVSRQHRAHFLAFLSGLSPIAPGGGMLGGLGSPLHRARGHMATFRHHWPCGACGGEVYAPALLSCSHICGNKYCLNPEHIALERMGHHACQPTIGPLEAHGAFIAGNQRARHHRATVALHPHTRVAGGPGPVPIGAVVHAQPLSVAHRVPLPRDRHFITPPVPLGYLGAPAPGPPGTHHQAQTNDRLSVLAPHHGESRDGFLYTRSSKRPRAGHSMCPSIYTRADIYLH